MVSRVVQQEAVRRGIRTFLQAWVAVFLMRTAGFETAPSSDVLRDAITAATWAGVVALMSVLQNALEDAGALPPVLKAPRGTTAGRTRR
jgi:hypothetical protein